MRGKRDGRVTGIRQVVDGYLRSKGLVKLSREALVPIIWAEVVGPWYRKHTEVLRVEGGVIMVRCDSSARAQQLQLDSARIIDAINERLEAKAIKEIRPSSGGIRRGVAVTDPSAMPAIETPAPEDLELMKLTKSEARWVEETAACVAEGDLRESARTVLIKYCKSSRWLVERGHRPCQVCGVLVPPGKKLCRSCDPGRIPLQGSPDVLGEYKKDDWGW